MPQPRLHPFKRATARLRADLAATDPSLGRLRMAARVTLTLCLNVVALFAVHQVHALSAAAYGVAMTTAMQGALQIKDATGRDRVVTRLYAALAGFGAVVLAVALASRPLVAEAAFIVLVFAAVYTRKYGTRWNAVGMFAFMCYFIGSYLHPSTGELPGVALAIALSSVIAHLIRVLVLPERPRAEFLRAVLAVGRRVGDLSAMLAASAATGWTERRRREAHRAQDRIGEAVLIAESYLPSNGEGGAGEDAGQTMAVMLFDLHLASETALIAAETAAGSEEREAAGLSRETALRRLDALLREAQTLAWLLPRQVFERTGTAQGAPQPPVGTRPHWIRDPALRLAAQVSLASAIAMGGGLMLSKTRWFWAILTAFLVFVNTQSRGDTALRALNRAVGTLAGIALGIGLATLLHGQFIVSSLLIVAFTFAGFYLLQLSYGAMVFFVTLVLSLLYGLLGEFTPGLLLLRFEETLIGTVAGVFIAFAVFPQKTTAATDRAADAYLSALDRVLAAAASGMGDRRIGFGILGLARHLDRRQADLALAARPLGSNWQLVRRPGTVRRQLIRLSAASYWTRSFAKALSRSDPDETQAAELKASIERLRARIAVMRKAGMHFLDEEIRPDDPLPVAPRFSGQDTSRDDPVFALDVLAHILDRLSPGTDPQAAAP